MNGNDLWASKPPKEIRDYWALQTQRTAGELAVNTRGQPLLLWSPQVCIGIPSCELVPDLTNNVFNANSSSGCFSTIMNGKPSLNLQRKLKFLPLPSTSRDVFKIELLAHDLTRLPTKIKVKSAQNGNNWNRKMMNPGDNAVPEHLIGCPLSNVVLCWFFHRTDPFFHLLMAGDEKWILDDNPRRKKQWLSPSESKWIIKKYREADFMYMSKGVSVCLVECPWNCSVWNA